MYASVYLDAPLFRAFTYAVPEPMQLDAVIGARVLVPFGKQSRVGFIGGLSQELSKEASSHEIKSIFALDAKTLPLPKAYWEWLATGADYYVCPFGMVLGQAIPGAYWESRGFGNSIIVKGKKTASKPAEPAKNVTLSSEQAGVVESIWQKHKSFHPTLLQGITGSGKTEVYIELMRRVLAENKNVIYLVPEIGLTPQLVRRLAALFDGQLLVNHSGLTPNQRLTQWQACLDAKGRVMVGTRSALFSPFPDLGLIIIDEEQDSSYKQEDRFRYHARDMALLRGKRLNIPVLMGSATPSLETYYLATQGLFAHERLTQRVTAKSLPNITVIDIAKERQQRHAVLQLSMHVHDALRAVKKAGKQAMVFVGQRGFAQNAYCVACEAVQVCPNCSVGLKFHKKVGNLKCHYCDYAKPFDEICSTCKTKSLTLIGSGAEMIFDEICEQHPGTKTARVDSDTMTTAKKFAQTLKAFEQGEIDVLVGTQMIAKGHDFSGVSLAVVTGIDAHMGMPDFRSGERAFQTIVQVAGRSGRQGEVGVVYVQSHEPLHPSVVMGAAQNFDTFAQQELAQREALNYPPFCRLVQLRFTANSEARLKDFFEVWNEFLNVVSTKVAPLVRIYGPLEMPIGKIRGKFRWHILLKGSRGRKIQDLVRFLIEDIQARRLTGIQVQVDIDPVNMI